MAVTFGGKLEFAVQQELSVLHPDSVYKSLIDLSSKQNAFSGLFRRKLQDTLMSTSVIAKFAQITGERITDFFEGKAIPMPEEIEILAGGLGINARDLYPPNPVPEKEVVIERFNRDNYWTYPSEEVPHYTVASLAGSTKMSEVKGFNLVPLDASAIKDGSGLELETAMHTFGYNYTSNPCAIYWQGDEGIRHATLEPRASFYLKPLTKHAIRLAGNQETRLMVVRIGGNLSGDTFFELSSLPKESMVRLLRETGLWY